MQEPIKEDFYRTLQKAGQGEFKDRGSKFLGFAYPAQHVEDTRKFLHRLKTEYHDARHFCFAYRIDPLQPKLRANDDGEPTHSAGAPILNQIAALDLWNTLVVVIRYFGGTKLGVAGLMNAYKTAAQLALENAPLRTAYITKEFRIRFPYKLTNEVMRLIKEEELSILAEHMSSEAAYTLAVRKNKYPGVLNRLQGFHEIRIS